MQKVVRRSEGWHVGGLTMYTDTAPVKREILAPWKKLRENEPQTQWEQYLNIHIHTYIHTHNHLEITEHAYNGNHNMLLKSLNRINIEYHFRIQFILCSSVRYHKHFSTLSHYCQ